VIISCTDNRDLDFLETVALPTNISASYSITQDNTGLVTITPLGEGAVNFEIGLGDGSPTIELNSGESTSHTYTEGNYDVTITAYNVVGDSAEATQQLIVSFQAPSNLVVVIENDTATSKQVNVTTNADFATMYDFYTGDPATTDPISGNIGDTVSYLYPDAGTYSIRVVAKGAAIETTEYLVDFEVTEILAPTDNAATPPARNAVDVVSIFSDAYTDITLDELPTVWSVTGFEATTIGTDNVWKLTTLDFLGIVSNYTTGVDLSSMEMMHIDYWVPQGQTNELLVKIVNTIDGGEDIESLGTTVDGSWQSIDIDMTGFDGGNLANKEKITQLIIDSDGEAPVVYIDNFYFWKAPSGASPPLLSDDFEGNGNIPAWIGDSAGADDAFANPFNNADNFSETVLEYVDTGGSFANVNFTAPSKFNLTNGQSVFSIKIYVPSSSVTGTQTNQVSLKLQNSDLGGNSWQTQTEVIKPIILDQWQTITFDFVNDNWININFTGTDPAPIDRSDLDKVVIQVNSENNSDAVTAYIDDFYYGLAQIPGLPPFVKDGFEGRGTIAGWTGDSASADIAFANPFVNADNNSPTVLEYEDTGGSFANVNFTATNKFSIADKGTFSIKIYVPSSSISGTQTNQVSLKLQNSALGGNSWQTQTEVIKPIVLDQWQIITFDFVNDNWININFTGTDPNPIDRTDLDKVVIQVNSENNNDTVIAYIDNVDYY
tara:strand:- start:1403 stop:3553 length:2151 start_codon:yes stop_codon:yes gene_type:complete